MEVKIKSRVCMPFNDTIYETDSKMDYLTVRCDRFYKDVDLSVLYPYLKIRYGDGSCNVCNMIISETTEQEIVLKMPIDRNITCMSGEIECQPMLKTDDGTQVFNCSVFVLSIKPSVRAYEYIEKNTPPTVAENFISKTVFNEKLELLINSIEVVRQSVKNIQNELENNETNYVATAYALESDTSKNYTKGGSIDKKFKELIKRIAIIENRQGD